MHHHVVAIPIENLRPTQMTVGYAEVRAKRREWEALSGRARRELLASHVVPCVIGPRDRRYLIDHHHLCIALTEEHVGNVWTHALEDFSWLDASTFWEALEYRRWVHPYDAKGRRRDYEDLPKRVDQMKDDPYRSLAAAVRRAGGYTKDVEPFAEFAWADFFRRRVGTQKATRPSRATVLEAVALAHAPEARYLPGWSGAWES